MRVLVVAPQPFFTPRGTPFSVYYRALVMAEQGAQIDLLTYGEGQDVDIPGVRAVRIPDLPWLVGAVPVGPSRQKAVLDVLMVLWTLALLVRHRYHAVHAHEESVFWCRLFKPLFGFRLIYDMHSSLPQQLRNFRFSESRLLYNAFLWLEESCLRAADAVIAICPDLRDYALSVGVQPQRLLMIENSIFDDVRLRARPASAELPRMPRAEPDPGRPWVLYAGTFEAYQGLDLVLRGFSEVARRHPEVQLVLAGGTEEQVKAMQELADQLQLGASCVLTGRVSKTQAMRWSSHARVLVSPRVSGTNTPLKVYEQLASGVPLVATRIWSHTQVLDESVCFLVEPDPSSIAAGILAALDDQGDAAQRAANAKGLYEKEYARPIYEGKIRRLLEVIG